MLLTRYSKNIRWRSFFVATFATAVLLATIAVVLSQYLREHNRSHEINAETLASGELLAVRAGLEQALYQRLSLPIALKAFVTTNPDFTSSDFEAFAGSLKDTVPGIMSLQLAPDAIVMHITNTEENRAAIGHNLLGDEARRPAVVRAIENRQFIVAGPLDLLQGGRAIIARLPVFIDGHEGSTGFEDFWGFATVLIDVDELFESAGLNDIDPRIRLAARGVDGFGDKGDIILGDPELFIQATRLTEVKLPNGSWQLAVAPKPEAFEHDHPSLLATALVATFLLAGLIWALVYRQGSRELLDAKLQAEAASKLKSDFIAVMSHEMRTPLNGILGVLELLRGTRPTDKQSEYIDVATVAGEHLLQQVNAVLDISKVEVGLLEIELKPIDLQSIVDSSLQVNRSLIETKGLLFGSILDLPTHKLKGAPNRVQQVLVNLIANAVKFTDTGKITVEVKTLKESDGFSDLKLSVTDEGIGIAADQQDRVFEDFVTLDAGYSRNVSGSGLGLAISKRLVEAMGGEIGVESTLGVGSRFWFRVRLPWASDANAAPESDDGPAAQAADQSLAGAPLNILIVEDNETNRLVAREMLGLSGHTVEEARDGQEGVDKALSKSFDIILMDVSMPKKDGIQATREIRETDGPNRETPILGLTAHALSDELERFLDVGMDACLTKPIRVDELNKAFGNGTGMHAERQGQGQGKEGFKTAEFDPTVIDDLVEVLPSEMVCETLEKVRAEIEEEVSELDDLLVRRDFDELSRRAHRLAGTAAIVGAVKLVAILRDTEDAAKLGKLEELQQVLPQFGKIARAATDHIRESVKKLSDERV